VVEEVERVEVETEGVGVTHDVVQGGIVDGVGRRVVGKGFPDMA
jgi:hypothetical protein